MHNGIELVIVFRTTGWSADGLFVDGMAEDGGCVEEAGGGGLKVGAFDKRDCVGYCCWRCCC